MPETKTYATDDEKDSPFYLKIVNLLTPLLTLGYGSIASLILLGVLPVTAIATGALPIGIALLTTMAVVIISAWLAPIIRQRFFPDSLEEVDETPSVENANEKLSAIAEETEEEEDEDPQNFENELPRALDKPSVNRGFSWDMRIAFAAEAFALTAIVIGLLVINPASLAIAYSALDLIQGGPLLLALIGSGGAILGALVGLFWKKMALRYRTAELQGYTKIKKLRPMRHQRFFYLGSVHDIPFYARLLTGICGGVAIASTVYLWLGIGAPIFAGIALGIAALAIVSPYVLHRIEIKLPLHWRGITEENPTKEKTPRFWFKQSTIDIPWYTRLLIGSALGLSLGALLPGMGLLIAPIAGAAAAWLSPMVFALLDKALQKLQREQGFWGPTAHSKFSHDYTWYIRLFATSLVASSFYAAFLVLGLSSGIALGISLSVPVLALASPLLFALLHHLPLHKFPLLKGCINPRYDTQAGSSTPKKHFTHSQWYLRIALGSISGGFIATALAFTGWPLLSPVLVISFAFIFLVLPPLYNRLINFDLKKWKELLFKFHTSENPKPVVHSQRHISERPSTPPVISPPPKQKTHNSQLFQASPHEKRNPAFASRGRSLKNVLAAADKNDDVQYTLVSTQEVPEATVSCL